MVSYIENSIKKEKNSPYVALENAKKANIKVTICEKILYNYINSGLFLNINKSHLPYNKKDKWTKPKEKTIRKKGGRSIEERGKKYFYAHSYCSEERGSNEANNKFVRRFLPKGVSVDNITKKEVKEIQNFMNNYPRKIFNSSTSQNIYDSALNLI